MKQGDFNGVGTTIYDPATIAADGTRQPFPGNRDSVRPVQSGDGQGSELHPGSDRFAICQQPLLPGGLVGRGDDFSMKIDRRISGRQNLYGRFSWDTVNNSTADPFHNDGSPDAGVSGGRSRSATLDDSYLIGGWVFHGNLGYAYVANPRDINSRGFDVTTLGFPTALKQQVQIPMFPAVRAGRLHGARRECDMDHRQQVRNLHGNRRRHAADGQPQYQDRRRFTA